MKHPALNVVIAEAIDCAGVDLLGRHDRPAQKTYTFVVRHLCPGCACIQLVDMKQDVERPVHPEVRIVPVKRNARPAVAERRVSHLAQIVGTRLNV